MEAAKAVPLSVAAGYDNQPMFSPDGSRILFAANRDGRADRHLHVRARQRRRDRLTDTLENESTPVR